MKMMKTICALALAAFLSGCGTMMRSEVRSGTRLVYPATRFDGMMIADAVVGRPFFGMGSEGGCEPVNRVVWSVVQGGVGIVDLPISLVTDTVLLPYDLTHGEKD